MRSSTPEISIITVNYNGLKDTIELCGSIRENIYSCTYELIVVDNGSRENEAQKLQDLYPWIKAIRSEVNLGFSGGNNLGIKQSVGEFIFLLNNDTYLSKDNLHFLKESLEQIPQLAAVSPKIKFAFPPQNIQFAGYTALTPITLRNKAIGFGEADQGKYDEFKEIPLAHGAALMINRKIIDKIGLMPEIYFLYYEEIDWCTAMTEAGYKLGYDPRCTVFHKESQSTGQNSSLRAFYLTRNRLLFAWRHRKNHFRWLALGYQFFFAIPVHTVTYCMSGKPVLALSILKGAIAFLKLKKKNNKS